MLFSVVQESLGRGCVRPRARVFTCSYYDFKFTYEQKIRLKNTLSFYTVVNCSDQSSRPGSGVLWPAMTNLRAFCTCDSCQLQETRVQWKHSFIVRENLGVTLNSVDSIKLKFLPLWFQQLYEVTRFFKRRNTNLPFLALSTFVL